MKIWKDIGNECFLNKIKHITINDFSSIVMHIYIFTIYSTSYNIHDTTIQIISNLKSLNFTQNIKIDIFLSICHVQAKNLVTNYAMMQTNKTR